MTLVEKIQRIFALIKSQDDTIDVLMAQAAESNLRVRYIMEHFKFQRQGGILAPGVVPERFTLYELYLQDRATFMQQLEQEAEAYHARQGLSTNDGGTQPGSEPGPSLDPASDPGAFPGPQRAH